MISASKYDITVVKVEKEDFPAAISIYYKIKHLTFKSKISYSSIQKWSEVQQKCSAEQFDILTGTIILFDSMRFFTLGAEKITLPEQYAVPEFVKEVWHIIFRNSYAEWRYFSNMQYPSADYPKINCLDKAYDFSIEKISSSDEVYDKKLLTNGGGKDSLFSMLELTRNKERFDIYQAYLPLGGDSKLQKKLLDRLTGKIAAHNDIVEVFIEDDFTHLSLAELRRINPEAVCEQIDFFVGHTANYVGFFPLIIQHGYNEVLFNIESTSDRIMQWWKHAEQDGIELHEPINHQYCKSTEYRNYISQLFSRLFPSFVFSGFNSSLQDKNDTEIYKDIISHDANLLTYTHSCNFVKPWCGKCPKCCFCYLMMNAYVEKEIADRTFGLKEGDVNPFDDIDNADHWKSLLNEDEVAWECVAPTDECLEALKKAHKKGIALNLSKYVQ